MLLQVDYLVDFSDEMFWYCDTCDRNNRSVCRKGKPQSLLFAALTILLTIVVAFIATMIIGFEDVVDENDDED